MIDTVDRVALAICKADGDEAHWAADWRHHAQAAISAYRAATMELQPIETAPKIGVFLVYLPKEHRKFEVMYRSENASIVGGAFGFDRTAPTHWMPLPDPSEAPAPIPHHGEKP